MSTDEDVDDGQKPAPYDEMLNLLEDAVREAHRKVESGRVYDAGQYRQLLKDRELDELRDWIEALKEDDGEGATPLQTRGDGDGGTDPARDRAAPRRPRSRHRGRPGAGPRRAVPGGDTLDDGRWLLFSGVRSSLCCSTAFPTQTTPRHPCTTTRPQFDPEAHRDTTDPTRDREARRGASRRERGGRLLPRGLRCPDERRLGRRQRQPRGQRR